MRANLGVPTRVHTQATALSRNSAGLHVSPDLVPRTIPAKVFLRFQELIYREAGIWLSEAKTSLLTGRLSRRLRALDLKDFAEYYNRVVVNEEERWCMLDAITTNETHFFREPGHFHFLEQEVFPAWQQPAASRRQHRTIRVWSAGCSTGQEAYSLAMVLVDRFPPSMGWSIEIFASDISRRALAVAEEGVWDAKKAHEIPPYYLRNYTLKGLGENRGKIKAAPAIRVVRFQRLNLNDNVYPGIGTFNLIFCRNVLIYFDLESRKRVIERLLNHLAPEGYLFLGHAETLNSICTGLRCAGPTVYSFAGIRSEAHHATRR